MKFLKIDTNGLIFFSKKKDIIQDILKREKIFFGNFYFYKYFFFFDILGWALNRINSYNFLIRIYKNYIKIL